MKPWPTISQFSSARVDFGGMSLGNNRAMSNTSPSAKAEIMWSIIPA